MPASRVFHSLKVEAIHGERFATGDSMRQAVFEYIETDDTISLGYIPPADYKARYKSKPMLKNTRFLIRPFLMVGIIPISVRNFYTP